MKELVVLSGKGGTGKTSVTASFAHLAAEVDPRIEAVIIDADVDASNLELVLEPSVLESHDFTGGKVAVIDRDKCLGNLSCHQVCRFDAIISNSDDSGPVMVDPLSCEGCGTCVHSCPAKAIHLEQEIAGQLYHSESRYGPLFHAFLHPARENSGKMVMALKSMARTHVDGGHYGIILVDGPPGIGCPVISAMTGADLVLVVTEPGAAGIHDLKRVLETAEHFTIPTVVCINKADINPEGTREIEAYCDNNDIPVIGRIPFDTSVTEAMIERMPVTAWGDDSAARGIRHIWEQLMKDLQIS